MRDVVLAIALQKNTSTLPHATLFACNSHFVLQSCAFQGHKNSNISYRCSWQCEKRACKVNWTCRGRPRQVEKVRQTHTQNIALMLVTIVAFNVFSVMSNHAVFFLYLIRIYNLIVLFLKAMSFGRESLVLFWQQTSRGDTNGRVFSQYDLRWFKTNIMSFWPSTFIS